MPERSTAKIAATAASILLASVQATDAAAAPGVSEVLLILFQDRPVLNDDVEHGTCPGPFWGTRSCPSGSSISQVSASQAVAHSGNYSYKLPAPPIPGAAATADISSGKLETGYADLYAIQRIGKTVRYSAYYYIASGFDAFETPAVKPWHVQMQWKMVAPERDRGRIITVNNGSFDDRYWGPQNPKIALGFHNLPTETGLVRQVQVTIRESTPGLCVRSFDIFTRQGTIGAAPLPVPDNTWIRITAEIRFGVTDGYIKVWQGETIDDDTLVVDTTRTAGGPANGKNTMSQLVSPEYAKLDVDSPCQSPQGTQYWSGTTSFDFGVDNYMGMQSYQPSARPAGATAEHLLYADDIVVAAVAEPY